MKKLNKVLTFFLSSMLMFSVHSSVDVNKSYHDLKHQVDKKMQKVDSKLRDIERKTAKLTGQAKIKMKKTYEEMLELRDDLKEELSDAKDVTKEQWYSVKNNIEDLSESLEDKVDELVN